MTRTSPWWLALVAVTACGPSAPGGGDPGPDASPPADATVSPDAGCPAERVCGGACCATDELCAATTTTCTPRVACTTSADCQGDTYCDPDLGVCLPWPDGATDDACTQINLVGVFAPDVQCEWLGPPAGDAHPNHRNVLGTPAVVDFDLDGDPGTLAPSIVFVSYDGEDGGAGAAVGDATFFGVIRVIDGATCAQQASIATPAVIAASPVAIADLDLAVDGRPEIVAHRVGGGLVAFRYDAAAGAFALLWQTTSTLGVGVSQWSGPSVYDLDDDGAPEVLQGASVFAGATGASIDETLGLRKTSSGQIPVVADLDVDGVPELVAGDATWSWDASADAWVAATSGTGANGLVAVADFGTFGVDPLLDDRASLDGIAEIAVVSSGTLRVRTSTTPGRDVLAPVTLLYFPPAANPGTGGPPTIADFDGDGRVEVGVAGRGGYNVFDPDCTGTPDAATCASLRTDGILWAVATQDISSSVTGSSVFDFEGDGKAEIVYADECFSRVYDGTDGEIVHSAYRTSCTWYENPIVADVDGDFNSEIVIPSNSNCAIACPTLDPQFDGLRCETTAECPGATTCAYEADGDPYGRCRCTVDADCGGDGYVCRDPIAGASPMGQVCRAGHPGTDQRGVRVVRDALDRWVNSRPIWNQHAYAVTHVDDAGVCPLTSAWEPNWTAPGLNNFRQAIAGDPDTSVSPDLTGAGEAFMCDGEVIPLTSRVCNRGTEPVGAGVPVTFYPGAPASGPAICTATTAAVLAPGACAAVTCAWASPPADLELVVTAVADDDGTGTGANTECHEDNNRAVLRGSGCSVID